MSTYLRSSVMAIAMVAGLGILGIPVPGFAQGKAAKEQAGSSNAEEAL